MRYQLGELCIPKVALFASDAENTLQVRDLAGSHHRQSTSKTTTTFSYSTRLIGEEFYAVSY